MAYADYNDLMQITEQLVSGEISVVFLTHMVARFTGVCVCVCACACACACRCV